jgi:hypothetical protein
VSGRTPAAHPEKPLETLIFQRFCVTSAVAKRGISGYNMSYFKPVLCGSFKYRRTPIFQVSKSRRFGLRASFLERPPSQDGTAHDQVLPAHAET